MKIRTINVGNIFLKAIPFFGLLFFVVSIFLFSDSVDTLYITNIAFIVLAVLTIVTALLGGGSFYIDSIAVYMPIILFSIISIVFAMNRSLSLQKAETLIILVIMVVLINNCVRSGKLSVNTLLFCIMAGGLAVAVRILSKYGVVRILYSIVGGVRIGGDILQLNYLGRYTYYGALIAFYFAYYKSKPLFYVVFAATAIVCVGSESRQAIISLILCVILLYMLKGFSKKKVFLLIRILLVIGVLFALIQIPGLEAIKTRVYSGLSVVFTQSSSVGSDLDRLQMIKVGFQTFLDYPIFGIGLGNIREISESTMIGDRSYLHNNYVELLACGGIVGFATYYFIYFKIFSAIAKVVRMGRWGHEIAMAVTLLVGQLILDLFAVNYYSKIQYILFAFALLAVKSSEKENTELNARDLHVYEETTA